MSSGLCIVYAPGTFAHDGESKAVVIDPRGDPDDGVRAAIDACPMGAITAIPDDEGA